MPIDDFPTRPMLLFRGLTRRCAWCGDRRGFFVGWFRRQPACRRCGHGFRRGDQAFELGALTANIILTFGTLLLGLLVLIALTAPDVPVGLLTAVLAACAVICPVVYYPVSYTLWQAVDLWMRRPTDAELRGDGDTTL